MEGAFIIDKKLKELGKYAEEIHKKEPLELIEKYLKNIDKETYKAPKQSIILGDEFGNELVKVIDKYKSKGISDILISYHLISLLVSYIKRSLIEEKAAILGIENNLYKQQMQLLYKGK